MNISVDELKKRTNSIFGLVPRIPFEIIKEIIIPMSLPKPSIYCSECSIILHTIKGVEEKKNNSWVIDFNNNCYAVMFCRECFDKKYSFRSKRLDRRFGF